MSVSTKKPWVLASLAMAALLLTIAYLKIPSSQSAKAIEPSERRPEDVPVMEDVALMLIDAIGSESGGIKAGEVTASCRTEKVDGIPNQYELLKTKIRTSPGNTNYLDGVYVTLAPLTRRPLFQVRFPNPSYCQPFKDAYEKCYLTVQKETEFERLILPTGRCIKVAAKAIAVKEDWAGLIEALEPPRSSP